MARTITCAQSALWKDGAPILWSGAEYRYYREDPADWQAYLRRLKALGLTVVLFPVPWRHHEASGGLDFTGRTRPDRDLVRLLDLTGAEGLLAILKPGPFLGSAAEFGGLPDDLAAGERCKALVDSAGDPRMWDGRALPTPLAGDFMERALAWLEGCLEAVVFPLAYPDGPIVALQLPDDDPGGLLAPDYSELGLAAYRRRFGPVATPPDRFTAPEFDQEILPYLGWSRHLSSLAGDLYRKFSLPCQEAGLPIFVSPATGGSAEPGFRGLDGWLSQTIVERRRSLHSGFALPGGPEQDVFWHRLLAVKRCPGPDLTGGWSTTAVDGVTDARAFAETVLAIAAGATGFNVGALPVGGETLQLLTAYLSHYGGEIVTARRNAPVSWALYPPYAALATWSDRRQDWAELGVKPPRCGAHALDAFIQTMRLQNRDFALINVEEAGRIDQVQYPVLTLAGGFFMDAATQRNLLAYVRNGGNLILLHEWPVLNDQMEICTILREGLESNPGSGRVVFIEENPFENGPAPAFLPVLDELGHPAALSTDSPETQAWLLRAANGSEHYFVLSVGNSDGVRQAGPVSVRLPRHSAAMLRVSNGNLTAALVKGLGDGTAVTPMAMCGSSVVAADGACDLLWVGEENLRLEVRG